MSKQKEYESMGTHWKVEIWDEISEIEFEKLMAEIIEMSNDFDNKYSRFKLDSFVHEISQKIGVVEVGEGYEDFIKMLEIYFKINKITLGKINPLIGNTISDFGYDENYSLEKKDIIRMVPKLEESVKILSNNKLEVKGALLFDFGAIGKGYFVDKISDFLKQKSVKNFLVDGSGDIYYFGESYKCGLENPFNFSEVIGVYDLKNASLCSSSTNRRSWGKGDETLNHYIDPDKLKSVEDIVATFVVADSARIADAMTSALFFVQPEVLLKEYKFEYLVINKNKQMKTNFSPGVLF